MKLTRREAEVLDAVAAENTTPKQIALALGVKRTNLSKYVRKLKRFGLITIGKNGRAQKLELDKSLGLGLAAIRADFPQLRLQDMLAGYAPFLLAFIQNKETFGVSDIDLPVPTAKRILAKLRNLGLVSMPKKGAYRLRDQAGEAAGFCRNMLKLMHLAEAKEEIGFLDYGIYSFDSAREVGAIFVARQEAEPKHYWPTFLGVAHEYGLQLLPAGRFYYASKRPDIGDVIIHTLAAQKNIRGIIYASAIALKTKYNVRKLIGKRQTFGLGREYIEGFAEFIESGGKKPFGGLDSFDELRSVGYEAV